MILIDIVNRNSLTHPWGEGERLPFDDSSYAGKLLHEQLNPSPDNGRRSFNLIDSHVDWIHSTILGEKSSKILEVGCGPGLYTGRLAQLGHDCTGTEGSSAAVEYARGQAKGEGFQCAYIEHENYGADFGKDFDLIMMLGGGFNAYNPMDAYEFFGKAWMALNEGGILLLEPYTFDSLEQSGNREPTWFSEKDGIFSDKPYLCLYECCFSDANDSLTKRWYVVDAESAEVRYIAQCYQAYSEKRLQKLFVKQGFLNVRFYPSLTEGQNTGTRDYMVVAANKNTANLLPSL